MKFQCPICRSKLSSANAEKEPFFPFCSERCRLVDLGKWLMEDYFIPGKEEGSSVEEPSPGSRENERK